MKNPTELSREMQIATMRFAVVAPMVHHTYTDKSMAEYARRIASEPITLPDGSCRSYSPQAIMRWKYAYDHDGMQGLLPKGRSDKGSSRVLSDEAQAEIARLHSDFPRLSACEIRKRLAAENLILPEVSHSSVQRHLRRLRDAEAAESVSETKERRAFEAEAPGILWQADTAFTPSLVINGRKTQTYMMIIIDDYSRMIVGAEIFLRDNALNFQKLLKKSVKTYGRPTKLLTDNGAPYANEQLGFICASIGTVLIHAKPRDAKSKGKVERIIRTCRDQFFGGLDMSTVLDLEDFNRLLQEWVRSYNDTVHSTTKQKPRDRFLESEHPVRRHIDPERIDECFFNRTTRKVRTDSTIQIRSMSYDVPTQFIGQRVEIWFSPDDAAEAFIPFGEERHWIHPTDRIANGKARRQPLTPVSIDYSIEVRDDDAD